MSPRPQVVRPLCHQTDEKPYRMGLLGPEGSRSFVQHDSACCCRGTTARMTLLTLDPASFRRPKGQQSTRHLYLANCGYGRGESVETVLARLEPQGEVLGLHVGDGGVSYASFSDACTAEKVKANLEGSTSWVIRFAELSSESTSGVLLPESVEATQHVEVPGLHVVTDFITDEESVSLLREIDARPWDTSIKRRVQHYGHAFDYATLKIAEQGTVPTMPSFAAEVISRLRDSSLMPHEVDQLTVNEYEPGVGIAFHVDAHSAFEDGIAAITLGSGIVMEFLRDSWESVFNFLGTAIS